MQQIICQDLRTLLAWAVERAIEPDTVVAFLTPTYDNLRNCVHELDHIMDIAAIDGKFSSIDRTMKLKDGGRIIFYTFEMVSRLFGAEFNDAAIHGLSLVPVQEASWFVPRMWSRLRRGKDGEKLNMMAFAD